MLIQWRDGSETWTSLKNLKELYPVETAEYAIQAQIHEEPAFAWWVPQVIKKCKSIILKVKSKYWSQTHTYSIRVPKSVREAKEIDAENRNTLWWDAICEEMKNERIALEEFGGHGCGNIGPKESAEKDSMVPEYSEHLSILQNFSLHRTSLAGNYNSI